MSLFSACFPSRPRQSQPLPQPLPPPSSAKRDATCVFCDISKNVPPDRVLYEDADFYVFKDRSGGARQHLLCIPKGHISESVQDLSAHEIPLLERMASLSLSTLAANSPTSSSPNATLLSPLTKPQYLLGFHIPPLTSVPHLHLHAFELPFDDFRNRVEFRSTVRGDGRLGKKIGWFVGVGQVMDMLQAGMKVTVGGGKVPAKQVEPMYRD